MFKLKQKIFKCCFLLLFYCERKHSCIWLALLQGELRSLFFGEPHRHTACFKCIKLRDCNSLERESCVCPRTGSLPPPTAVTPQPVAYLVERFMGPNPQLQIFFFSPRTVFCCQGCYSLNIDTQSIYYCSVQNSEVVSMLTVDIFVNIKHSLDVRTSFYRCN